MSKSELEIIIIDSFKENYKDFPKGELLQSESPDFTIVNGDIKIGIEIAEVFQDSHASKGSKLKQIESVQKKFEESLMEAIQKHTEKHLVLGVELVSPHTIASNMIEALVKECLPSCLEFIMNNESYNTIHLSNHYYQLHHPLPDEVDEIFIMIAPDHVPSFNDQSQGGTVSNLEFRHIEPTLKRHSEALFKYKPCNEYWLLIREGNYYAGSFQDVDIPVPIQSAFDKVFLLRTRHNEVIELK